MSWIDDTQKAINYIEDNLLEVSVEDAANYIYSSNDHFQKMFLIVTGFTVSEYIRNRKLTLAGQELLASKNKIIDIALKYGYETHESFTKAFTRFHGFTPSKVQSPENRLRCFSPLTIQINITGGFVMSRKIIPNVEKLYGEDRSGNYMFDSCMSSVMKALNENEAFDFLFFAGVTGDLFSQTWYKTKWSTNNEYSTACRDTEVPIRAAFDACGYEYEYVRRGDIEINKQEYIRKIVGSIDKGYPVLTFGIAGPPTCSIIFGYDENGDVLIGWSQFTDELIEDRPLDCVIAAEYFQVRNGLDRSEGLIFFTKKKNTPSIAESYRKAILNISKLASLPGDYNISFGGKAFDDWADSLLCDDDFKNEYMLMYPSDTYGSCMVMVGTNVTSLQNYLNRAYKFCPDLQPQIEKLKSIYQKELNIWLALFQREHPLLDRKFREYYKDCILEMKKLYLKAANIVKRRQKNEMGK